MHELALSESIVRGVLRAVEVGALSAVNVSSLELCLRLMLDGSGMEHAQVKLDLVPAQVECQCGHRYSTEDVFSPCPACGGYMRQIIGGEDVTVQYVEIEDEESQPG